MKSDPCSAVSAPGRSSPCVSEITPIAHVGAGVLTCLAERSSAPTPTLPIPSDILPQNAPIPASLDYPRYKRFSHQASPKRARPDQTTLLAKPVLHNQVGGLSD